MRNVRIDDIDHVTRTVIAIGTDYPPGHLLPMHSHRRAQLLYGATGVMHVFTQQGNWVVPPQHAVWLPPPYYLVSIILLVRGAVILSAIKPVQVFTLGWDEGFRSRNTRS